jgi:mannose-6-phosphate isomerase
MKLARRYVEKPWGRKQLPAAFDAPDGKTIGEMWFESPAGLPLLAKYLFTGETLSVQVHPDDAQARAMGLPGGKSECWYVLEAEPGAAIGLGLRQEMSADQLRAAALDGSIEQLLDWREVEARDFYFVPAGTIHAIGAGLTLLEFQQNSDVTFRLYDYGRPRELHLDKAIQVAKRGPYSEPVQHVAANEERVLVDGQTFTLVLSRDDALGDRRRWVLPLDGTVRSGGDIAGAGECLLLDPGERLESDRAWMLTGAKA